MLIVTRKSKLSSHVISLPLILKIQTIPIKPTLFLLYTLVDHIPTFSLDQSCYLNLNIGNISQSKNEKLLIFIGN